MGTVRKSVFLILVVLLMLLVAAGAAVGKKPTRVIIFTMDQMKPWYVDEYDMDNIKWLQDNGANFINARVGQMASETVVSHNTIVSGLFPKHMGWADEVTRLQAPLTKALSADPTAMYPAGSIVTVGDLVYSQYAQLIDDLGYPKLGDYMHAAFPDSVVANFGEKKYQVESTAASSSDYWVYIGSSGPGTAEGIGLPWTGKYRVPGGNLPSYINGDQRYFISSGNTTAMGNDYYGTKTDWPAYLYPEDGRHVPGPYEDHLSGDVWVTDAALEVMYEEDWSALHLNFSGIDKIGHMYGGGPVDTFWDPTTLLNQVHMRYIAKVADDQVGRIVDQLRDDELLDDTLVVVLADHGSTYAETPYYKDVPGGGTESWYFDPNSTCANTIYGRASANNAAVLAPLNANGNLAYSYQSTAIEAWLVDRSWSKKLETAAVMKTMPGVIATYARSGSTYKLISTGNMTAAERSWWASQAQTLINTMAFEGAADVVGLLKDRTSYGVYGDHGGAQKDVQRIPMVMYVEGMEPMVSGAPFKLADVMPTVLRNMGIPLTSPVDGKAYNLPIAP